ncbi:hypothetical protein CesoFtcFv8_018166 [Champsocephalus esox]|uniref:Uncharacterized protein n=1 Tax=Champsocephalus esox TaxID=159716 RepID=A0AAN8GMA3_9TELE|nr:hypothetical protein CesoFtcFv8_018166 [Champsocephalus esox]
MTCCGLEGNAFLTSRKKFYWTGSRDLLETVEREEMICSIRPAGWLLLRVECVLSGVTSTNGPFLNSERIMPAHIKHLIKSL